MHQHKYFRTSSRIRLDTHGIFCTLSQHLKSSSNVYRLRFFLTRRCIKDVLLKSPPLFFLSQNVSLKVANVLYCFLNIGVQSIRFLELKRFLRKVSLDNFICLHAYPHYHDILNFEKCWFSQFWKNANWTMTQKCKSPSCLRFF